MRLPSSHGKTEHLEMMQRCHAMKGASRNCDVHMEKLFYKMNRNRMRTWELRTHLIVGDEGRRG